MVKDPQHPQQGHRSTNAVEIRDLSVFYGNEAAVKKASLDITRNSIVALIGPSGCGKSTLLRSINRMNDFVDSARIEGSIFFNNLDVYARSTDPVSLRREIGMVFQKPNPFPCSIRKNITWGPTINGYRGDKNKLTQEALQRAALWDEVRDKLDASGYDLSGGQQQRLCIARTIAMNPQVILMDEPCSALDPVSTNRIEKLILELKSSYTIVIVTHNMQQARRISDYTAFMYQGELIEYGTTEEVFEQPKTDLTRDYVSGRFG